MNLLVQIANHTVGAINYHAEVQPKIADSGADAGKYPRDFERPRKVGDFYTMDSMSCCPFSFPTFPISHHR
jgi:hypothetical protein